MPNGNSAKRFKKNKNQIISSRKSIQKIKRNLSERDERKQIRAEKENEETQARNKEQREQKKKLKEENEIDQMIDASAKEYFDESLTVADDVGEDDNLAEGDGEGEDVAEEEAARLTSTVKQHKKELEKLKQQQPEFYEYLQKSDQELLDFDDDDDDLELPDDQAEAEAQADGEQAEGEEEAKPRKKKPSTKNKVRQTVLTHQMLNSWKEALAQQCDPVVVTRLLLAFRVGAHSADADLQDNSKDTQHKFRFLISHSKVFHDLMTYCLKHIPNLLWNLLGKKSDPHKEGKNVLPHMTDKYAKISALVRTYVGNLLHFLQQQTDPDMRQYVLSSLVPAVPFFAKFSILRDKLLKTLIDIWSSHVDVNEDTRVYAFVAIREMAQRLPFPYLETCLKSMYLNFVRSCKNTSKFTLPAINLMSNCVVELFGIDFNSSYQHAFIYIRQLALHLRNCLTSENKQKEGKRSIYNWAYLHGLKVFAEMVGAYASEPAMRQLIYPLSQLIIGVIQYIPTARYYPLRIFCLRVLNKLARSTKTFINTLPFALEILENPNVTKKVSGGKFKPIDISCAMKFSKEDLGTKPFQEVVCQSALDVIVDSLTTYSYSIAFPELAVPCVVMMRKFKKNLRAPHLQKQVHQVVEAIERSSTWVSRKRDNVTYAPKDVNRIDTFLSNEKNEQKSPLEIFAKTWVAQQQKLQALLDEAHAAHQKRQQGGAQDEDEDEDDGDADGDGDGDGEDGDGDGGDGDEVEKPKLGKEKDTKRKQSSKPTNEPNKSRNKKVKTEQTTSNSNGAADEIGDLVLSDDE